ncbi:MAG TPA: glycosyltransferase [Cyclobacteriaceae bacterium]|nr:glycosyltransferase [Cyclobacteriaceae bacterium]
MKVLFVLLPARSHYISCFPLARQLQSLGFEVVFTGGGSSEEFVTSNGFSYELFRYMMSYEVRGIRSFAGTLLNTITGNGQVRSRFREFMRDVDVYTNTVQRINPDFIFIDEHLSHYYAYRHHTTAKTFLINTKLPSGKSDNVPPLNSTFVPKHNFVSKLICDTIWSGVFLRKKMKRFFDSVAFGRYSSNFFHSRYVARLETDLRYTAFSSMLDYDNIVDAPTIVLMSGKFNYRWRKPAACEINLHYWNTPESDLSPELRTIVDSLSPARKLIYIAMGSMLTGDPLYVSFIRRFVNSMMNDPCCEIIVATGNSSFSEFLRKQTKGKRVYVFERVPQKALLPYCSMMITHCGLNSVKECIYAGVPMLGIVNPAHQQTDTIGNAARIVHHRIGLSCRIDASEPDIREKTNRVLLSPEFAENIRRMKAEIDLEVKASQARFPSLLGVRLKQEELILQY